MPSPDLYASLTADDLVTGDGVALDLPPASVGTRMVSGLLDVICTLAIAVPVAVLLLVSAAGRSGAVGHIALVASMITIFLVLPTTVETVTRGRSPGKAVMGLRTVRDDGGPISFSHAFVRALVGFVEIYAFTGAPAFLSALVSPRGKRLGDHAAGTYVVRDRVRLTLPTPVQGPPELHAWASGADMTALPVPLALRVRQFLARTQQLHPVAREETARRLAGEVLTHVAPAPPTGTHPERVLAAVVAERRTRDLARWQREEELRRRLTRAGTAGR